MGRQKNRYTVIAFAIIGSLIISMIPIPVSGNVKPITDAQNKLNDISEEEKAVLKELFTINQKMEELEAQKEKINGEIDDLKQQISDLEKEIETKQEDYDRQLNVLKEVLVDYQRGGPATYLEILLGADDLSAFLKSMNVIKDISHNVKKLLVTLKDAKKELQEEKDKLDKKAKQLEQKQAELAKNLEDNRALQEQKQNYLASLKKDESYYTEQLDNLQTMWDNCKKLFPKVAGEIMKTIDEGYFTLQDLNFSFINSEGYIEETTFNNIMKNNPELSKVTFNVQENQVVLNVPEEHLMLTGNFVIADDKSIRYEVTGGTFYDLPLEQSSIDELFENGPLLIDFKSISDGIILVDFTLKEIESREHRLEFKINIILK